MHTARLKPKHDKRVRGGHPWVFSNELAEPGALPEGGAVEVRAHDGSFVGRGYANPNSLIAIRILTRTKGEDVDSVGFWKRAIDKAARHRARVCPERRSLRLVHAEGDGLPGLVVDRFGDVLAVQLTTLGTERRKEQIREALAEHGSAAVLRNEGRFRALEGLPEERADWWGDIPEYVDIDELGVRFRVGLHAGQKTGHFFDQAVNRHHAGRLCEGLDVLDVYANTGGWALQALVNGARSAVMIDKREDNCEAALVNAELNGVELEAYADEGKKTLQVMRDEGRRFGAVVLDPPAFAKTRKAANSALRGYEEINGIGLDLVRPGGLFFTSSCSFHVHEDRFVDAVHKAARKKRRTLTVIRRGEQAPDHPVIIGIPETRYLKSWAFRVD